MNRNLLARRAAILAAATLVAARGTTQPGGKPQEASPPLFKRRLLNVQDKAPLVAEVPFPPGAASPRTHPKLAFIYAYVQLVFPDPN